jgi:hypothetical protein
MIFDSDFPLISTAINIGQLGNYSILDSGTTHLTGFIPRVNAAKKHIN